MLNSLDPDQGRHWISRSVSKLFANVISRWQKAALARKEFMYYPNHDCSICYCFTGQTRDVDSIKGTYGHTVCNGHQQTTQVAGTKERVQRAAEGWYYISCNLFPFVACHSMAYRMLIVVEQLFHTANSKWVWSGNATIVHCRPTHRTLRKRHRTPKAAQQRDYNLRKATRSLFLSKMIVMET